MEDKNEQVKTLFEGAMSLYHTIESESRVCDAEHPEPSKKYTNAEDKIKEVLNGEEPLYIPIDDAVSGMLFQYANLGYGVVGIKYLEMLLNNKTIATTVLGYALQTLNQNTEELIKYKNKYGELEESSDKPIEEKELKGISE